MQITDSYILTTALKDTNLSLPKDDRLMDLDEAETITIKAFTDFSQKNSKSTNAAQQALIDVLVDFSPEDVSTKLSEFSKFLILLALLTRMLKKLFSQNLMK